MRILLVEDDSMIGEALRGLLMKDCHAVDWAASGQSAAAALRCTRYDLVILDLGLPDRDGLAILRELRGRQDSTPVIIATARDAVESRIAGLDAGADDYIIKPYDYDELLARVRSVGRRAHGEGLPVFRAGEIEIDPTRHVATRAGQPVILTAREWAILESLIARPGSVLSREQLEDKVFGWGYEIASNVIQVHVHGLRRKLGAEFIQNIRGLGYRVAGT